MLDPLTVIFGMSALGLTYGIIDKVNAKRDEDEEMLNDFFKSVGFCNKKEEPEFAKVKYVQKHSSYKIFGIDIPVGCDVRQLMNMKFALENLVENDVEILYDNQNYRVKIYGGKLKGGKSYMFNKVEVPSTKHMHVTIGETLNGALTIDLSDTLPHILIAGTAGAGKSRLVKAILCQLIENYTPEQLRILYLDNKGGVEANAFKHIKHLQGKSKSVEETIINLLEVKKEMFRRLELIEQKDVTNLVDYNKKVKEEDRMPFMFVVIDELFSFAMLPSSSPSKKDPSPEEVIFTQKTAYRVMAEIASMSRASGIHLMFCTQRPTDSVIPTNITCNCGIRIGLRTSNEQESRNIIEQGGLELIELDAKGQGIVKTDKTTRFQSYWITDKKVKEICDKHKREKIVVGNENVDNNITNKNENKNVDYDWFIPSSK